MANTGWQICRCILSVSINDNSILLDRNGMPCSYLDSNGVPVSAAGLKQAAKVLSSVNVNTEYPPGKTKTYSQLYDIVSTYTVSTTGISTSTSIYQDGVIVGRYRGNTGESCEISSVIVLESSPLSAELIGKANSSSNIQFSITSSINGISVNWSITSFPNWLTVQKDNNLVKITSYQRNLDTNDRQDEVYTTPTRTENILLTQSTSNETLTIPVSQLGLEIVRMTVVNMQEGFDYTLVYLNSVTNYLGVLIDTTFRVVSIFMNDLNVVTDLQVLEVIDAEQDSYVKVNAKLVTLYGLTINNMAFSKL